MKKKESKKEAKQQPIQKEVSIPSTTTNYLPTDESLPDFIRVTNEISNHMNYESDHVKMVDEITSHEKSETGYLEIIPSGVHTFIEQPNKTSYYQHIQLTIEDMLKNDGWIDTVLNSENISDQVKYYITMALNQLSNTTLRHSFLNNIQNVAYATIESVCRELNRIGIGIDPVQFIEHYLFKEFIANGTFNSTNLFNLVFDQAPIPVVIEDTNFDDTIHMTGEDQVHLKDLTPTEFSAVTKGFHFLKTTKLTEELYTLITKILRDLIYQSDWRNGDIDLSTVYGCCMSAIAPLFNDTQLAIELAIIQAFNVGLYNSDQNKMREGLIFEMEEPE